MSGCFSPGQAYVACSRGRSAATMQIENFHENQIITSEVVKEFYTALKNGEEYQAETWDKTLDKYEEKERLRKELERKYRNEKCKVCGGPCIALMVGDRQKKNFGRFFVRCRGTYNKGHTFIWVDIKK